jgi:hypothetical protein
MKNNKWEYMIYNYYLGLTFSNSTTRIEHKIRIESSNIPGILGQYEWELILQDENNYIFKRPALKKRKVDDVMKALKMFLKEKPLISITNAKRIWGIIPYNYQITDIDDNGWQELSIGFILKNISNQWQSKNQDHLFELESIYLTTEEGYRYTPDKTDTSITTKEVKIPPGFELKGFSDYRGNFYVEHLIFEVAQNTTGYKLYFPGYDAIEIGENIEGKISQTPNRFPTEIPNQNSVLAIDEYRKMKVEKTETINDYDKRLILHITHYHGIHQ